MDTGTFSPSAYLLSCCRQTFHTPFCYYIDAPKFIDLSNYQKDSFQKQELECTHHHQLLDHDLNPYSSCTDLRAWCLDDRERRKHFLDIACRQILHCGSSPPSNDTKDQKEKKTVRIVESKPVVPAAKKVKSDKPDETLKEKPKEKSKEKSKEKAIEKPSKEKAIEKPSKEDEVPKKLPDKTPEKPPDNDDDNLDMTPVREEKQPAAVKPGSTPEKTDDTSKVIPSQDNKGGTGLCDDILDKLNCNLENLEATFDKFVKKNRDFIQNLLEHLNFEKQKQEQLENNYCKLKQENDILRTSNEYLKMVNGKQIKLFAKELDKAIDENKTIYKKKIQQLERMILYDKENLQCYKENELRLLETLDNEKKDQEKLRKEVCNLKHKQTEILANYMKVLYFLEDVKKTLKSSCGNTGVQMKRSCDSSGDSQINSSTKEVLRNAFCNGLESLNVRDLSVLHDAVQEQNERLCHQSDFCGKNPATNVSISHMSMACSEGCDEYPSTGYVHRGLEGYDTSSNLSFIPSRQRPDRCNGNVS